MILNNNINTNINNNGNDFEFIQQQSQSMPLNFPMFNNSDNNNSKNNIYQNDIYGITDTEIINCLTQEKNDLAKFDNIKIEISLGEKKPGTFFSKAYQTYVITIPTLNLKVVRRYSDFEWFRSILINLFPGRVIPPIPKKKQNWWR